jgi:hypothetical protein
VKRIRRISALKAEARSPKDMRGRHSDGGNRKSGDIIESIGERIQFPFQGCSLWKLWGKTKVSAWFIVCEANI